MSRRDVTVYTCNGCGWSQETTQGDDGLYGWYAILQWDAEGTNHDVADLCSTKCLASYSPKEKAP